MSILSTSLGGVLLVVTCTSCDPADQWGTPPYFERLTGVAFAPEGPSIRCQKESGFDEVAFVQVRLPREAVDRLRARPGALSGFPHQLDYERERKLKTWASGPLSAEAQAALDLALAGAALAIEESGCGSVSSAEARESVLRAMERPTTFYTYQYKPVGSEVLAEALDFRVLDLEAGVLYELVNFS